MCAARTLQAPDTEEATDLVADPQRERAAGEEVEEVEVIDDDIAIALGYN